MPSGRPSRPSGPMATPPFEPPTSASVAAARTGASSSIEPTCVAARDRLSPAIRRALDQAIANVRRFAETQRPASTTTTVAPGVEIERRWSPIDSVGAYVPGGSAPYPSSLVMTVVPAQVAGVGRIVVASPADRDGVTNPVLLGAAGLLEIDAFVVAGGAQAIGALAYGLPGRGHRAGRPDRRSRQRVGHRGQDRSRRRRRDRPAGRALGGHGPGRTTRGSRARGRGPDHPGGTRTRFTRDPRHHGRPVRRCGRGRGQRCPDARRPARHPRSRRSGTTA